MNAKDPSFLEEVLVPKALEKQHELLDCPDDEIVAKTADSILDRSKQHGKKGTGGSVSFIMDKDAFAGVINNLGKMLNVDPEEVRNVTPRPKPKPKPKITPPPKPKKDGVSFEDLLDVQTKESE